MRAATLNRQHDDLAPFRFPVVTKERFAHAVKAAETATELHRTLANNGVRGTAYANAEDDALEAQALVRTMLSDLTGVSAERICGVLS